MSSVEIEPLEDAPKSERGSLWSQVASSLRDEIVGRVLQPGQQMATELGLSERFGVSRFTVRRALAELEKEGLVRIEHGRGLFVSEDIVPYAVGARTRFTDNMRRFNLAGDRRILSTVQQVASALVCEQLMLEPGSEVLLVESVASVGGRPMGVAQNFYPAARFPTLAAVLHENPSSTDALRSFGVVDYTRKSTCIISRLPTEREAHLLKIARSRPVLEIQKVDIDLAGIPVAFGIGCHSGDRVQLIVE